MEFEQALKNEIQKIRARLADLMALDGITQTRRLGGPGRPRKTRPATKARRKKRVSAARRKQMAEHGVYLGVIRNLSATNKARVKKLRAAKGVPAAIREAKRLRSAKPARKISSRATKGPQQVAPSA